MDITTYQFAQKCLGTFAVNTKEYRLVEEYLRMVNCYSQHVGAPIPMRLRCDSCHRLHIDTAPWDEKPHHTHACQGCGNVWRPAIVNTVGVRFLPGFKNDK